ncbi:MAG: hypothetical protein WKF57_00445 [Nakamurella sp.]
MTKSVSTALAILTALMAIAVGVTTGLGERYLEPSGITTSVYCPRHTSGGNSAVGSDNVQLSCGSAWKPSAILLVGKIGQRGAGREHERTAILRWAERKRVADQERRRGLAAPSGDGV